MGLTPQFTKADIQKAIRKKIEQHNSALLNRLKYAGEQFVNLARKVNTYTDQTGNLRSSIGYMILYNSETVVSNFQGKVEQGKSEGKKIAEQIARDNPRGYVIVGVAGMDYAAAVEVKGKDVITDSSRIVRKLLILSLDRLKQNFNG